MPKHITPLKQAQVLGLKPKGSVYYKTVDNNGLYVRVRPTGKSWVMRTRDESRSWQVVGDVNTMPMAMAQNLIGKANLAEDTKEVKKIPLPTFKVQAKVFIDDLEKQLKNDKNIKQWTSTMTEFAYPVIGDTHIDQITTTQIKDIINTILPRLDTATKMRSRMERIIDSAWIENRPEELYVNPASKKIVDVLAKGITKKKQRKHHLAVPIEDAPKLFQDCWAKYPSIVSYAALCFIILTIGRSGMGVKARWEQIKGDQWIIDGKDMKAGIDHVCPLSTQALKIIELRKMIDPDSGWVFPSPKTHKQMTTDAVLNCLQFISGERYTVHGWRTTFKQWASERDDSSDDDYLLSELALAHKVGDKTQQAYFRTTLYKKRQKQNQEWADFLFGK